MSGEQPGKSTKQFGQSVKAREQCWILANEKYMVETLEQVPHKLTDTEGADAKGACTSRVVEFNFS